MAVYLYADRDEGEAPTTLRDRDDERQERLRAHVTLQQEAEAHRAATRHFSSSPREGVEAYAEAYSALVREFTDGTIDIAA
ncbi:hypothetical protein Q3V23_02095 [Streptomyces sp. VNUA116]|uniref:hypothetical protein n=1 Tax=Streptomyces sp. VNUA116 TaxID=3062449 RepID=UPI002675D13C|nr:hypothetical protein [Streptomyces sp. VNUA116]WKU42955.1 hypothetical protein Q3V23_02095 [Streptomyces sp. VNUA116]